MHKPGALVAEHHPCEQLTYQGVFAIQTCEHRYIEVFLSRVLPACTRMPANALCDTDNIHSLAQPSYNCRACSDTLTSFLLQDQYQPNGQFKKTKVAFCVHNIAYQVGSSVPCLCHEALCLLLLQLQISGSPCRALSTLPAAASIHCA